jgi:RNA polymerase sigma factor (sigma-70 family)
MPARPPGATLLSVTRPPDNWSPCSPQVDSDRYADWDEIYSDNVVRLYRMMYAKVGNRPDAEDLTAEVFRATLRPLRLGASRPEVRGYLAAAAQSTLAAYWRRRIGAEATRIELADAVRFLDDPQTDSDAGARAERLLERLPERYRQILKLRFLDTLSVKEAAATMGVSVPSAKVLQYRALRMAAKTNASAQLVSTD